MFAILSRSPANKDFKFCEDARDAAASAPRNIAEGFARYGRKEFVRFLTIARGRQLETQTNLRIARNRGYLSQEEFERIWKLSEETVATTLGLLRRKRG